MKKPGRAREIIDRVVPPSLRTPAVARPVAGRPYHVYAKPPVGFVRLKHPKACRNDECSQLVTIVHRGSRQCLACMVRKGWRSPDLRTNVEATIRQMVTIIVRFTGEDREAAIGRFLRESRAANRTYAEVVEDAFSHLPGEAFSVDGSQRGASDAEIADRIAVARSLRSAMDPEASLFDRVDLQRHLPYDPIKKGSAAK